MSNTTVLATGLAEVLASAGIGLTWNPTGTYPAGQTGIFMKIMPQSPDRVVTINVVWAGDDITMPRAQPMIQIRGRGLPKKPLDVDDLLDPIVDVLHGRTNLPLGGLMVVQINRRVSAPLGADENGRWERVDQYYADVDVPPTINRPEGGSW
ncbi:minor capsid protein [Agromyces sp. G08B096]|uniref:Minor capsid protein n=1 Tax=Agromyces sp. G08B096 TaxID=3156399 RepID=A0AAU7W328_9MICO